MTGDDLDAGQLFPDVELPDHAGNVRLLSDLAGEDPLLLQFYRGWWCPKEQAFFRRMVPLQDEAEVGYVRFVSISIDDAGATAAFRAGIGARWTFLSDCARDWIDRLGLVETTDEAKPYRPTVFTLGAELRIHRRYDGYWFWGRPTADELRTDFRELTRAMRREWIPPAS